jgi:hypothetical protein
METTDRYYVHVLEGAITGIAQTEADLGTISAYTVHIMRMVAEKATNRFIRAEAVVWLQDNADEIAYLEVLA